MKIERVHWRHYFGGISLLLIIIQLLSGLFLTLFYVPYIKDAYHSIQELYRGFTFGAWTRDIHRWVALFVLLSVIVHTLRSLLRKEFMNTKKKLEWITGSLMLPLLAAFIFTGIVLPWEWKGYWFMEMLPNYLAPLPFIGPSLKAFMIKVFTIPRNYITHILILPIVSFILVDLHFLFKLRKRGIFRYLLIHSLITIPIYLAVVYLAVYVPMPTRDPQIIPMPLDGTYIPAPEWFYLILFVPFLYFKGFAAAFLSFYLPLTVILLLLFLPFIIYNRGHKTSTHPHSGISPFRMIKRSLSKIGLHPRLRKIRKVFSVLSVVLVITAFIGLIYLGSYKSPTMGCSACHNLYSGMRMGVPPEFYKDRNKLPLLNDTEWMTRHWFYPQIVW